jgi:hypothetical protein
MVTLEVARQRAEQKKRQIDFALQMRIKRENSGLKATWVAEEMGIPRSLLSMLETGDRPWTPRLIKAYEKVIAR